MKFLKISSLLVLSLLLFAPSALADVDCELRPDSQRMRAESQHEMLESLTVRCEWDTANDIVAADGTNDDDSTFDLELQFSGDLSNDDDMDVTLWLMDTAADSARTAAPDADPPVLATNAAGNRIPAPVAEVGRDSVYWEGVEFPENWTVGSATSGTFTITGIYIDATSVGDERLRIGR